jgi:hypothetical protein
MRFNQVLMAMESTTMTWCGCVAYCLDESVSIYIDVGGRCFHVTC